MIRHAGKNILVSLACFLGLFYGHWVQAATLICGPDTDLPAMTLAVGEGLPSAKPAKSPLGVNTIYFVDDDRAWDEGLLPKLRPLRLSALRFPGGEVADRYDWETGGKDNPGAGGKESTVDIAGFTDYLEFLEHAKAAGINDSYFVVNLEGAFRAAGDRVQNVQRYAEKAARWVAEVKRRGYRVRYWEIGNESYHGPTTFPLTAAEYAEALTLFSRAMKRADPSIVIAANGPRGKNGVGFADKFTPEQLAYFRGKGRGRCGRKPGKDCISKIRQAVPGVAHSIHWWDVLLETAGKDFDMAVVHSYSTVKLPKSGDRTRFKEMNQVQHLRAKLEQGTGRKIAISVTEWNVPPKRRENISRSRAALLNVIKLGTYKVAGVEHAHLWPLRYPGTASENRALLTMEGLAVTPMYRAFEAVAPVMNGAFVDQRVLANNVYVLKTVAGVDDWVMLVNAGKQPRRVELRMRDGLPHSVSVDQFAGEDIIGGELCQGSDIRSVIMISLPPGSLTIAHLMPK